MWLEAVAIGRERTFRITDVAAGGILTVPADSTRIGVRLVLSTFAGGFAGHAELQVSNTLAGGSAGQVTIGGVGANRPVDELDGQFLGDLLFAELIVRANPVNGQCTLIEILKR
jgi:hypothetical protein